MRGKGEQGATGLRSSARVGPVCFRSAEWVSQKAGPSYQGTIWGSSSQAPAAGELPAPAAVRRGWGGRAGGQSAEFGSRRGDRRRPQPPTVCKRPPLWGREEHPAVSSSTLPTFGEGSPVLCALIRVRMDLLPGAAAAARGEARK